MNKEQQIKLKDERAVLENEIDKLRTENKQLKTENKHLLKYAEKNFTFETTQNDKYSIFNSVRKAFAEKLKELLHNDYIKPSGFTDERLVFDCIDELLKEYEK